MGFLEHCRSYRVSDTKWRGGGERLVLAIIYQPRKLRAAVIRLIGEVHRVGAHVGVKPRS